jgi:hypothetical protein
MQGRLVSDGRGARLVANVEFWKLFGFALTYISLGVICVAICSVASLVELASGHSASNVAMIALIAALLLVVAVPFFGVVLAASRRQWRLVAQWLCRTLDPEDGGC